MKRERDNQRLQRAIDELIKICDDGHATDAIRRALELLRHAITDD